MRRLQSLPAASDDAPSTTKIESTAGHYPSYGAMLTRTIKAQLIELWQYAKKELGDDTPTEFTPISPEKIKQTVER